MRKRVVIPAEVTKDADALIKMMKTSSPEECVNIKYKNSKGVPLSEFVETRFGKRILDEF